MIQYGDLPDPKPGPNDCLVRVTAVDVNPIDCYIRGGMIPAQLQFPYIIGRDLAGTVVEVGANVKRLKPVMRVWASGQGVGNRQGTSSELAVVAEEWLRATPDGVKDEDIVANSLVGITAHLGLVTHASLRAGGNLVCKRRFRRSWFVRGPNSESIGGKGDHNCGLSGESEDMP